MFLVRTLFCSAAFGRADVFISIYSKNPITSLALGCADCVKLSENIAVFQLVNWPMLATKNAGLH
jgi:hypothetical protein